MRCQLAGSESRRLVFSHAIVYLFRNYLGRVTNKPLTRDDAGAFLPDLVHIRTTWADTVYTGDSRENGTGKRNSATRNPYQMEVSPNERQ